MSVTRVTALSYTCASIRGSTDDQLAKSHFVSLIDSTVQYSVTWSPYLISIILQEGVSYPAGGCAG